MAEQTPNQKCNCTGRKVAFDVAAEVLKAIADSQNSVSVSIVADDNAAVCTISVNGIQGEPITFDGQVTQ